MVRAKNNRRQNQNEEELQLRAAILDKATDAILVREINHNFVYVNETACKLYGYDRSEFLDLSFRSLLTPEDLQNFEGKRKEVKEKGELRSQGLHLRKDKSLVPVEVHSHRIMIARKNYIVSVVRDVTLRIQAENALRESEQRFRSIYENSPIGIELYNSEGRLITANKACLDIFGISEISAVQGFHLFEDPNITAEVKDKLKKPMTVKFEMAFDFEKVKGLKLYKTTKSGVSYLNTLITPLTAENKGAIGGYLVLVQDFTESRLAEEKIKQNEQQLELLFEAMTEGVSLISPQGQILKINAAEEKITGFKASERIGQNYKFSGFKTFAVNESKVLSQETPIDRAIEKKQAVKNEEVGFIRLDGSILWLNISAVPLMDESSKVLGVVRTITDITEQKRLREEKEQFTRKLLEVQEAERKRVARELHDDTAQNLALIELQIDNLLQQQERLPSEVLEKLKKLRENIDRTQQDVRRYSHELRPGVLDYLGLEPALEGLVEDLNSRKILKAELKIEGQGQRLKEEVELALFRVAQEATNNIRKHSQATQAKIVLEYARDRVHLTISDNGKGFKTEENPGAESARGMGLIGMQERAQLINAKLNIESILGQGTKVSIEVSKKLN